MAIAVLQMFLPLSCIDYSKKLRKKSDYCYFQYFLTEVVPNTVEIQYNGLEGTEGFWLLNPNVVKSNNQFWVFFYKKIK